MSIRVAILLVFFTCCSVGLFAQKPGTVWPAGTPGVEFNAYDNSGKKNGLWVRAFSNKNLYYRGQFEHGIQKGKFDFYYETGELMSIVDHIQDTTINEVWSYYPDGKTLMSYGKYLGKRIEGKFERLKDGNWKFYQKSGALVSEENYQTGELNGNCRYYYANGKLSKNVNYKSGIEEGPFTEYFENGVVKSEGTYRLGELEGSFKNYFDSGQINTQGQYERGLKSGLWIIFYQNGRMEMTAKFKEGKETFQRYENGTFMAYYASGIPKNEYSFEDGKKNGPFTEWYDKGSFVRVSTAEEEQQLGIMFREKLEGTQIAREGEYLNDFPDGEITFYNEDGRVTMTETWEAGKLIGTDEK